MFIIFRFLIAVLIVALFAVPCYVFCLKKQAGKKSWFFILVAGMAVVLLTVLFFLPFENIFYSFQSPEDVFSYKYPGTSDIQLVIEGQESALVIGDKERETLMSYVRKEDDNWKLDVGVAHKEIATEMIENGLVLVYQYRDSHDYYIEIIDMEGTIASISDNLHSQFVSYKGNEFISYYYAAVTDFDENYSLTINDTKISLTLS